MKTNEELGTKRSTLTVRLLPRITRAERLAEIVVEVENPPHPFEQYDGLLHRILTKLRTWNGSDSVSVSLKHENSREVDYAVSEIKKLGWTTSIRGVYEDSTSYEDVLYIW